MPKPKEVIKVEEDLINSLSTLDDLKLNEFYKNCCDAKERKREQVLSSIFDQIDKLANENGFDPMDVVKQYIFKQENGYIGDGRVHKIQYRNDRTGEEWTGRGKTALWIKRELANGAKLEDFEVKG